jgi:hypothetical protein
MPQSLVKNLIHLVYSTKHRSPWIPKEHQESLWRYQNGICKDWDSPALVIGGIDNHVHALFSLSNNHAFGHSVSQISVDELQSKSAVHSVRPGFESPP